MINITLFSISILLNIMTLVYALFFVKREGLQGYLGKSILMAGISTFIFGVHHFMEIIFEPDTLGIFISEILESVAAVFLILAVYYFVRIAR